MVSSACGKLQFGNGDDNDDIGNDNTDERRSFYCYYYYNVMITITAVDSITMWGLGMLTLKQLKIYIKLLTPPKLNSLLIIANC